MKVSSWKEPSKSPKIAVDPLIVKKNKIVLSKRTITPFKGMLQLPGGMVEYGETIEHAVVRESREETGLKVRIKEILGVYSGKSRDPRFLSVSVAFIMEPIGGRLRGSFEGEPIWCDIDKVKSKKLGFDHTKILKDYVMWKKKKGTYWSTK
ncbi:MAG: NUDIX hydrolase [Candidatus Aenigmarchaeota archaeon]|nr:NUDIX hydrolase [Candidatus Aenigmarchaeota archaeon]